MAKRPIPEHLKKKYRDSAKADKREAKIEMAEREGQKQATKKGMHLTAN